MLLMLRLLHLAAHIDARRSVDEPAFDARKFAWRIEVMYQEIENGKPGTAVKLPFADIRLPEPEELARYNEPSKVAPPLVRRKGSTDSPT